MRGDIIELISSVSRAQARIQGTERAPVNEFLVTLLMEVSLSAGRCLTIHDTNMSGIAGQQMLMAISELGQLVARIGTPEASPDDPYRIYLLSRKLAAAHELLGQSTPDTY